MVQIEKLRADVSELHAQLRNETRNDTRSAFRRVVDPDKTAAKYKLEVQFSQERSAHKPFAGSVHFWLSGTQLHGGGDELIYPCPDDLCGGLIPPKLNSDGVAVCPTCKRTWASDHDLKESTFYKLPIRKWAEVVARDWQRLEHNADVYLKFHPVDIRPLAMIELKRGCGGEKLDHARNSRRVAIYELSRILQDINAGAELSRCVFAFLTV